ncbi:MAG: DUF1851 domain-containing protein [Ignavibacteriaceae bacterium]|nr:DUF1851 domain-containing protein [Ignavibacteriaceae bacterium]
MFEKFMLANEPLAESRDDNKQLEFNDNFPSDFISLIKECGGFSFRNGLYRTHTLESSIKWGLIISKFFPGYPGCLPFGYDWMGCQLCVHRNYENNIYMFDAATGKDYSAKSSLNDFHNEGLIYDRTSYLSEPIFIEALEFLKLKKISYQNCLGFKIPLFLGGTDSFDNYESTDMEVYWEIQGQLFSQIK